MDKNILVPLNIIIGILLLPLGALAILDLSGVLFTRILPTSAGEWFGFTTLVFVICGAIAGLSSRTRHSNRRVLIHTLIAINGVIWLAAGSFIGQILFG